MKKNKLIPFKLLPGSWGLTGQIYKEAEASYYLNPGEELDRELAKIRYFEDNRDEYNRRIINIEWKFNHITAFERDIKFAKLELFEDNRIEYHRRLIEIRFDHEMLTALERDTELAKLDGTLTKVKEIELSFVHGAIDEYTKDISIAQMETDEDVRTISLLEIEFKHGRLKKNTFEKKRATILRQPWIGIIDQGFDPKKGINGVFFEFDWNSFWIEYLELNGYVGATEDEIVEAWFSDVCNSTEPLEENMKVQIKDEDF